ncbi:MAG TPA: DUF5777 family beta-barrel protein [Blastocatellia bacterium]|jgi:cytochrome c oxidase subunit 2
MYHFRSFALLASLILCCATAAAQEVKEIKVTMKRFEFNPKTITLRKGEKVKLTVASEDVAHGFAVSDFDLDVRVQAKQSKTVEFTPDKEGKFDITCSVFCGDGHPEMTGQMIVTSAQASGMKVSFDENAPGVVIVESNGERLRIDTATKQVTDLSKSEPAPSQPIVAEKEEERHAEERRASEPYDYRLINVPTPKRVPRHSLNVYFSHRFQQPVRQDDVPVEEEFRGLFGLDSNSISALGFTYGITDRLYANVQRSPLIQQGLDRTIEIGVGYHLLDERGRSPIALSAYASMEGNNNFSEEFTWNIQAMVARSVTKYVNLFFSPAVHLNSNGQDRFRSPLKDLFPLDEEARNFRLGRHTGSFGFGVNARIRPTASILFEYTPRVGFKMGLVEATFDPTFTRITRFTNHSEAEIGFGIEKRIGRHSFALTFSNTQTTTTSRYNSSNLFLPPGRFTIGFNLFRRLL